MNFKFPTDELTDDIDFDINNANRACVSAMQCKLICMHSLTAHISELIGGLALVK
jgi:hypothetical protein